MAEWNEELEKKILKKSRFTLLFRILWVIFVLFFLYAGYKTILYITFDKLNVTRENHYYSNLAVEWRFPNVRADRGMDSFEITPFGTTKFTYPLVKRVGLKEIMIGEVRVTKGLLNSFSYHNFSNVESEQLHKFSFSLPVDPRNNQNLQANSDLNVWETLEMLPEGTVAELAFSTRDFMDPEELVERLKEYDLHILWMPLYTGEFINFDPGWSGSSDMIRPSHVIGLVGGVEPDEDFNRSMWYSLLDETTIKESEQLMLENMERILEKSNNYYELYLGLPYLEEKYRYLKEEGFSVFGAVVTGPTKELLKLRDEEFVRGEQLGDVELWNW